MTSQPTVNSLGEGLQEESRRLQQWVRELLIQNQQLRMLLESANESPGLEASPMNSPGRCEESNSHKRSL
jgi:hypothetical protein